MDEDDDSNNDGDDDDQATPMATTHKGVRVTVDTPHKNKQQQQTSVTIRTSEAISVLF